MEGNQLVVATMHDKQVALDVFDEGENVEVVIF